jgi:L-alanine-DL-glutamate epimerase-like enolase superfamily enzyme
MRSRGATALRITGVHAFPLRLKVIKQGYAANQSSALPASSTVIVRITTASGISGLGEAAAGTAYFHQTMGGLLDWLAGYARALDGANPLDRVDAHRRMDRVSGAHPPACQPARAAIDLALHDIAGQAYGCPVYELLGGAYRTEFELQTNLYEATPGAMARASRAFVRKGYRGLKVKVGNVVRRDGLTAQSLSAEQAKIVAALRSVPQTIAIDADANQSWGNAKSVVRLIDELQRDRFHANLSIEQPLHHLDLDGHRYIRDRINIPLVLDESVLSPEAMSQIAKRGAADRVVLKFNRVGGLGPARRIVAICEAAGIGVSLDTMPFTLLGDTASAHLAASIRDAHPADVEGFQWFADTPFRGGLDIRNGRARLPVSPGFGVEIDEKKLRAMTIAPEAWR